MVRVKICGISDAGAGLAAAEAGADAIGMIFARSRRRVTVEQAAGIARALPPFLTKVGVFVDEPAAVVEEIAAAVGLDMVQLHGHEPPEFAESLRWPVLKAVRVKDAGSLAGLARHHVAAFLLDSFDADALGGTGRTFDWSLAADAASRHRVILSGGLRSENVIEAIERVRPYGVDVSSGVETDGRKDLAKIREFVRKVRAWEITSATRASL